MTAFARSVLFAVLLLPATGLSVVQKAAASREQGELPQQAKSPQQAESPQQAASDEHAVPEKPAEDSGDEPVRGKVTRTTGSAGGFTLFGPLLSRRTFLLDEQGRAVHVWDGRLTPGGGSYLLDDGSLLRCERELDVPTFHGGGVSGRIRRYAWNGKVIWDYLFATEDRLHHHDVEPLPNGNILLIAWERKTRDEAIRAGRSPAFLSDEGLWPTCIVEVEPVLPDGGKIVWEWHLWDHLVQDYDENADNFGVVAEHPERVNIHGNINATVMSAQQIAQLEALGYIEDGNAPEAGGDARADMCHTNAIDYNASLDQIALSVPRFDEIWIIDHSTTTEEAAGSKGGRAGKGGDLLYRWGNPATYGRGSKDDRRLFFQHDVQWIPKGVPGAGNLTLFNNGGGRPDGDYSTILELAPPIDASGRYRIEDDAPFGPSEPTWKYEDGDGFFSGFISGTHRLPGGNTFICSGMHGRLFEVTPEGKVVWEYYNPYSDDVRDKDGDLPQPGLDRLPNAVFRATRISADHPGLAGRELKPLDPQPVHRLER